MIPSRRRERYIAGIGIALFACLYACGPADGVPTVDPSTIETSGTNATPSPRDILEAEMDAALQDVSSSVDFSLCAEDSNGAQYVFNRGASTMSTSCESASTSKLVAAIVILRQVEKGYLGLDDRPQDWIGSSVWTIPSTDPLYGITLGQLLSFTSGLTVSPANGDAYILTRDQITDIAIANTGKPKTPGTEFFYHSNHLQVAGYMALLARREAPGGSGFAIWNDLFDEFRVETGLFATSSFDLPFSSNPRLAGGMHWTGEEYLAFLRALSKGQLLNEAMMALLLADHTPDPTVSTGLSPLIASPPDGMGEDWHYSFGCWQEYRGKPYAGVPGSRVSSPGAYGAYPFWDREHGLIGIVARQGLVGTFPEGINIERAVDGDLVLWAAAAP